MANLQPGQIQGPTPDAPAGAVFIPEPNWTLFRSLPNFDLRNGDPSDVTSVFMKATIAPTYHWIPIDGLTPVDGVAAMDGFIRSHFDQIMRTKGDGVTEATARKMAITLGVARAVSTTFYRITANDLTPGEALPAVLSAYRGPNGSIRYTVKDQVDAASRVRLEAELELNDTEKAVICALVKCATGIIPMQGYSLLMTGHHYLSQADSQSRKVFAVAEKAYWRSNDIGTWFTDDLAEIQNCLWHKSCHPVEMSIKEKSCMDPSVAVRLKAAGAGACASRLPASESELRTAGSYLTLLGTVAPMFEMFGGRVDVEALSDLVEVVKSMPVREPNPVIPPAIQNEYKGTVTNRDTGLKVLDAMLRRNLDRVAYCYGFYVAQSDSNATMGASGAVADDTLKTSYSLKKLKSQSLASFNSGYQAFGDYMAVRNKRRAEGIFDAPGVTIM